MPIRVADRKVPLVLPHGANEDFPGEFEEFFGEGSPDGYGILYEMGNNFYEVVVRKDGSGDFASRFVNFSKDEFSSFLRVDDHEGVLQPAQVFGKIFNLERAGSHESVAAGEVRGRDIPDLKRHDIAVEEAQDPMDGAGEGIFQVHPAHGFREGDGGDQPGKDGREEMNGFLSFFFFPSADVFSLLRVEDLQFFNGNALALGKTQGGLGRLPLFIESDALSRTDDFDAPPFLSRSDPHAGEDQPPGSPQSPDLFVGMRWLWNSFSKRPFISSMALGINPEGISSVPISNNNSDI